MIDYTDGTDVKMTQLFMVARSVNEVGAWAK